MSEDALPPDSARDRRTTALIVRRAQRLTGDHLGRALYSTPAWDMLLDLYLRADPGPMSLTSLSGASRAPFRTGLRAIDRLVRRQLLTRTRDEDDGRRINVALTNEAVDLLDRLFDALAVLHAPRQG